ncbi:MAG TPA: hypothetical protein VHG53_05140 [Candidatus Limnocylindria bacterium]|nr:hypothetical protein [Candidatus Limnocylindria bacterium]
MPAARGGRAQGRALRVFSAWLVEARILHEDPLAGVKVPPQPNTRRKPFKDFDVPLIIRTAAQSGCGERDVAIVVLALATGLRLNELRSLQWAGGLRHASRLRLRPRPRREDGDLRPHPFASTRKQSRSSSPTFTTTVLRSNRARFSSTGTATH